MPKKALSVLTLNLILAGFIATSVSAATIQPAASNDFLTNPGMGWQNMGSANLLPETVAYPDRQDVSWRTLNPGDGNYNWQALDSRLQQAISQGKQFSFRVYTMRGEDYGGHYMPDWVVSKGAKTLSNGEVDYSNCTYQAEWAKFVEALRQKYDGNPNIAYIDVSGYGNFNEWSWQDSQTDWDDDALNPTTIDGQARRRLADMFIGGSQNSHRCTNSSGQTQTVSYSYPGFQTTQLIMPYAGIRQSTYYVDSRRSDVGFRYDCLGKSGLKADHQEKLGNVLNDLWKTAPIAYELCGINWSSSSFINNSREVLEWAHASFVHDNPDGPGNVSAAQGLLRQVGYRYLLTQASYPDQVSPGGQIQIATTWQNVGYAPSYPKMGQNFELHFYIVAQNNAVAADLVIPANISQWLPATTLPGSAPANSAGHTTTVPTGLANGSYKTQIAIIDKRTNKPINLAMAGRDASGRYNLGNITVAGGSGATPTPTPTPTPTATPTPTSSATPTASPTATPNSQQIICQADINQDGTVNHQDYLILRQNFFARVLKNARADINQDGFVNIRDYLLYARNRNKTCSSQP